MTFSTDIRGPQMLQTISFGEHCKQATDQHVTTHKELTAVFSLKAASQCCGMAADSLAFFLLQMIQLTQLLVYLFLVQRVSDMCHKLFAN